MNYRGTIAYRSSVGGMIHEQFAASLLAAWDFLNRTYINEFPKETCFDFHFMRGQSCMLHDAANMIAEGFLGEWVLFLDTDHVFGGDALYEMIRTFEEEKFDILTGFTQKRQPPYTPILFKTDFDPLKNFEVIIPKGISRQVPIQIDSAGLACLMVRRKVFDDIVSHGEKPFDFRPKFNTTDLASGILTNFMAVSDVPKDRHLKEMFWEDVSFFWRAKMLGYKAWCAPWVKFHHLESRLVDESLIQVPEPTIDPRIPV